MSSTNNTRESHETGASVGTGRKAKPEPPHNVVLHNSWHPVSWVVYALKKSIPGMTLKRATRVMWTAHTEGRAVAKSAHRELAELYEERLKSKGLTASVEKAG